MVQVLAQNPRLALPLHYKGPCSGTTNTLSQGDSSIMKKQKGFSLIELLIVVAIILIIAAIAIPNLIKSKMAANEASAVGSVRTINTSQVAFASACPNLGFTNTLADFATGAATCPGASGLLDSQLVTGTKSGYSFALAS